METVAAMRQSQKQATRGPQVAGACAPARVAGLARASRIVSLVFAIAVLSAMVYVVKMRDAKVFLQRTARVDLTDAAVDFSATGRSAAPDGA